MVRDEENKLTNSYLYSFGKRFVSDSSARESICRAIFSTFISRKIISLLDSDFIVFPQAFSPSHAKD